jgi:hypothetical protein
MKWLQEPSDSAELICGIVICCSNGCFYYEAPCPDFCPLNGCQLHY